MSWRGDCPPTPTLSRQPSNNLPSMQRLSHTSLHYRCHTVPYQPPWLTQSIFLGSGKSITRLAEDGGLLGCPPGLPANLQRQISRRCLFPPYKRASTAFRQASFRLSARNGTIDRCKVFLGRLALPERQHSASQAVDQLSAVPKSWLSR